MNCPHCETKIKNKTSHGEIIKCPKCKRNIVIEDTEIANQLTNPIPTAKPEESRKILLERIKSLQEAHSEMFVQLSNEEHKNVQLKFQNEELKIKINNIIKQVDDLKVILTEKENMLNKTNDLLISAVVMGFAIASIIFGSIIWIVKAVS